MITLALDMSTKSSGWAIFEDQSLKEYGCITAGSANLYNRIHKMISELEEILKKYNIDNVIIEDVVPEDVKGNQTVFKALMYLQGFVMDCLDRNNLRNIKFFTSSEWRKKCGIHTGRGVKRDSLKPKDIQFCYSQFGIKANDDIADAICIGFAAVGGIIKEPQDIIEVDEYGFEFG